MSHVGTLNQAGMPFWVNDRGGGCYPPLTALRFRASFFFLTLALDQWLDTTFFHSGLALPSY